MSSSKIDWVNSLKKYVEKNQSKRTMKEIEEETDKLFLEYMEDYKQKQLALEPSLKKIPRFFQKNTYDENYNLLYSKVRQEVSQPAYLLGQDPFPAPQNIRNFGQGGPRKTMAIDKGTYLPP